MKTLSYLAFAMFLAFISIAPVQGYTLTVTSTPSAAGIWRNGIFTGHTTPHAFIDADFLPGDYSVVLIGYDFIPASYTIDVVFEDMWIDFQGFPATMGPIISLNPDYIECTLPQYSELSGSFLIQNIGDASLSFTINDYYVYPHMTFATTTGTVPPGESTQIGYTVNSYSLPLGPFSTAFTIESNDPFNPLINMPVDITVLPQAMLYIDPPNLDFGTVLIYDTMILSVQLTAQGVTGSALIINNIQIVGDAEFSIVSAPETPFIMYSEGFYATIEVAFSPLWEGYYFADLVITDGNRTQHYVPLSGYGQEVYPWLEANPSSLVFGNVIEQDWRVEYITLSAYGENWPDVVDVDAVIWGDDEFELLSPDSFSMNVGETTQVAVRFHPSSIGDFSASLEFYYSAGGYLNVPLGGSGVEGGFITPDPEALDFGEVTALATESLNATIHSYCSSGWYVQITSIGITGDAAFTMQSAPLLPYEIGNNQQFQISVAFTPPAGNMSYDANLVVGYNTGMGTREVLEIPLFGSSPAAPQIAVFPDTIVETLYQNTQVSGFFTISNTGTADLNFGISPSAIAEFMTLDAYYGTIPPDGSAEIGYTIYTTYLAVGSNTTSIPIDNNDPTIPIFELPVYVTVEVEPWLEISPLSEGYLEFGTCQIGWETYAELTLQIVGAAGQSVVVESITLTNSTDFELWQGVETPFTVTSEQPVTIGLYFQPSQANEILGQLIIETAGQNQYTVGLVGYGQYGELVSDPWFHTFGNSILPGATGMVNVVVSRSPDAQTTLVMVADAEIYGDPAFQLSPVILNSSGMPVTLPYPFDPPDYLTFTVTFEPTTTEFQSAMLDFTDSMGYLARTIIQAFDGTIVENPAIAVNPEAVTLTLPVDTIYYGSFQISNTGGGVLNYDVAPTGFPPNVYVDQPTGSLPAGGSVIVEYTVNTDAMSLGPQVRVLDIHSNDPLNPTVNFTINFEVIDAAMVVDFHAVPVSGHPPLLVHFYDDTVINPDATGITITGWRWDFDNDGVVDSYAQNPTVTYVTPGLFDVSLTVISSTGQYYQVVKEDYIHVGNLPPVVLPGAPLYLEFLEDEMGGPYDLSEFFADPDGDPLLITLQGSNNIFGYIEPAGQVAPALLYLFSSPDWFGTELIILTARDPYGGQVSHPIQVTVLPVNDPPVLFVPADLYFIRNSTLHLNFANYIMDPDNQMSQLSIEIQLISGTGQIQFAYTPVNLPNQLGQFTVDFFTALQIPHTETFRIIVDDHEARATSQADFNVHVLEYFAPQIGLGGIYQYAGQTVVFYDQTLGNPDYWIWEFGDGETSTAQHPSHTYPFAGTYSVRLTLGNTEANQVMNLEATVYEIDLFTLIGTSVTPAFIPPTWTLVNSPYNLFGEIIIPQDEDVEIEDGVEVNLFDMIPVQIQGMLLATGVTFQGQTGSGFWGGLKFNGTGQRDPSELIDCTLTNALLPIDIQGQSPLIDGIEITVTDTTMVVNAPAIRINGASSANVSNAEILNYGKGVEIETEPDARTTPSLINIRVRNSLETTRQALAGSVGGSIRSDAYLHNIEIENVETGLIIEQGQAYRDTANPSLINIRVRNSLETTRNASSGLLISGDIAPQIDSLLIEGVVNGILVQGGSEYARDTTTLSNIRIRTSLGTTRTETVGLGLDAVPAIIVNTAEIEGFFNGIVMSNEVRDTSNPSLINIRVRNSLETTRQANVGITITGAVVATIHDALIEDYPFGIKYHSGLQRTTSLPSLTNIRIRNSLETTRQTTIGMQLIDLERIRVDNDSIVGYIVGLEVINTDFVRTTSNPSLINIRVRNSLETTRYDNVGIFLGAGVGGTLSGAEVEEARIGIFIADGNRTNLGGNKLFNCETGIKAAGSLTPKPIRRQLIVLESPFYVEHQDWEFKGFDINLPGPWFIENNTLNGYTRLLEATDATIAFTNNIGWTWQPMATPFALTNSDLEVSYCDLRTPWPGIGNISLYPDYTDWENRDYTITFNSPCIDAGSPLLPPDPDGTVSDIGAYPYLHRASMDVDLRFIQPGTTVHFTNTSLGHDYPFSTAAWDLNNDNIIESTSLDWLYQFNNPGIYNLSLTMATGNLVDTRIYNAVVVVQENLLLPPGNPVIGRLGNDIQLSWDAVTSTVGGDPIAVEYYIIYSSPNPSGYFDLVGFVDNYQTNYLHLDGAGFNRQFYIVLGYAGTRAQLEDYLRRRSRILIEAQGSPPQQHQKQLRK